jgi:hypothetical protein
MDILNIPLGKRLELGCPCIGCTSSKCTKCIAEHSDDRCPRCGGESFEPFHESGVDVYECKACHFSWEDGISNDKLEAERIEYNMGEEY